MSAVEVCRLSDIDDYQARGFSVTLNNESIDVIVVRQGQTCFVYHNSCPHTGVNLEWQPDEFLNDTGNYLQCAMHGAMFQIEDGLCVAGPCTNQYLKKFPATVAEDRVLIENA